MSSSPNSFQDNFDSHEPRPELESPFLNEEYLAEEARTPPTWRTPVPGFQLESPFLQAFEEGWRAIAEPEVEEYDGFLDELEKEEFEEEVIADYPAYEVEEVETEVLSEFLDESEGLVQETGDEVNAKSNFDEEEELDEEFHQTLDEFSENEFEEEHIGVELNGEESEQALNDYQPDIDHFLQETHLTTNETIPPEKVEWIQTVLNKVQGERLKIDKLFGDRTRAALVRFQKANGLSATGKLNSETETALTQRGLEQIAQQSLFSSIGFMDAKTTEEIKRFQILGGLAPTGANDPSTRSAMVASLWGVSLPEPSISQRPSIHTKSEEKNELAFDLKHLTGNLETARKAAGEGPGMLMMKIGRIARPKAALHLSEIPTSKIITYLSLNDSVLVERVLRRPQDKLSWYYVHATSQEGRSAYSGWVRSDGVLLDPPEPEAKIHYVEKGEELINIAATYYKPKEGFEWGDDARFYVAALAFVNKGYAGINFPKRWKEDDFKRTDAWKEIHIRAGHAIWIPDKELLQALKGQFVSSGSISYEMWRKLKKLAKKVWGWIVSSAAFIAGLIHGALKCVYDLFADTVELVKTVWRVMKSLFTGDIIKDAGALWEMIKGLDVSQMAKDFTDKWNSNDPWEQGYFRGTVTGYVTVEILLAIFSVGTLTAIKWTGRFAKVSSVLAKSARFQRIASKGKKIQNISDEARKHLAKKFRGESITPDKKGSTPSPKKPSKPKKNRANQYGSARPKILSKKVILSGDTAGTGGIRQIWAHRNSDGSLTIKIDGELKPPLIRHDPRTPNFNEEGIPSSDIGLPDYERSHLWGPGFGDEARDGIMYAPRKVNQELLNRGIEGRLRELQKIAENEGKTIELIATAESYPLKTWRGHEILKEVKYEFQVRFPDGKSLKIGRVEINVPPPGSSAKHEIKVIGGSSGVFSLV
jgi:hypothetical protein